MTHIHFFVLFNPLQLLIKCLLNISLFFELISLCLDDCLINCFLLWCLVFCIHSHLFSSFFNHYLLQQKKLLYTYRTLLYPFNLPLIHIFKSLIQKSSYLKCFVTGFFAVTSVQIRYFDFILRIPLLEAFFLWN